MDITSSRIWSAPLPKYNGKTCVKLVGETSFASEKAKQTLVGFHRKFLSLFRTLHGRVYYIFGTLQNAGTWRAILNRA